MLALWGSATITIREKNLLVHNHAIKRFFFFVDKCKKVHIKLQSTAVHVSRGLDGSPSKQRTELWGALVLSAFQEQHFARRLEGSAVLVTQGPILVLKGRLLRRYHSRALRAVGVGKQSLKALQQCVV